MFIDLSSDLKCKNPQSSEVCKEARLSQMSHCDGSDTTAQQRSGVELNSVNKRVYLSAPEVCQRHLLYLMVSVSM